MPNAWWTPGPYQNWWSPPPYQGLACGGEWKGQLGSVNSNANTIAPMLEDYIKNNRVWVCPKRKRGLTFKTMSGDFDPSITGFLSYGFNECGVFGAVKSLTDGNMGNAKPFKASSVFRASDVVA